jgi:UrcA family protein
LQGASFPGNGEQRHAIIPNVGSSIEGETTMDTINASPKSSSVMSGVLSLALSLGAVAWAVSVGVGMASAQTPQAVAEHVSYADLDLRTEQGAVTLLKRLDDAAQRLCGPEPVHSPLTPRQTAMFERCVTEAVRDAVHSTDEPLVLVLNGQPLSAGASLAAR